MYVLLKVCCNTNKQGNYIVSEFIIIVDQIHICIQKARALISIVIITRVVVAALTAVGASALIAAGGL